MLRVFTLSAVFILLSVHITFAKKVKALFIGNSYIYTNDLPEIIKNMAAAGGDTFTYSSSVPGGTTFQNHCTNTQTLNLLAQGGWDYVILQEQSQLPSFPDGQVTTDVYPYAKKLDSLAHVYSPCTKTVFYMTWGRKNGDASNCGGWPPVCTYQGMDSLLQLRYGIMAANNHAWLSPVAKIWRMLRTQSPTIELYNPDESHPSEAGSYAAACSFYALLFGKSPSLNSYNYTLNATVATTIKNVAKAIVYDSLLTWQQHDPLPRPAFTKSISTRTITLTNQSQNATGYRWAFGDGSFSTQQNTAHTYTQNGLYNVCLTAYDNCDSITACQSVTIGNVGINEVNDKAAISLFPTPVQELLSVNGLKTDGRYVLYDISGRSCMKGTLTPTNNHIDVQKLMSGTYFLHITDKNSVTTQLKVIVGR